MADNNVSLPKNTAVATKMLENQHQQRLKEFGAMGWLFGGGSEKQGNIAAFILICCFIGLVALGVMNQELVRGRASEIAGGIVGVITLTIGYIFGRKSSE